jgi:hypothetical protein
MNRFVKRRQEAAKLPGCNRLSPVHGMRVHNASTVTGPNRPVTQSDL